jgi:hypothetical protein
MYTNNYKQYKETPKITGWPTKKKYPKHLTKFPLHHYPFVYTALAGGGSFYSIVLLLLVGRSMVRRKKYIYQPHN